MVNYDGRRFRTISNSTAGEADSNTLFDYRQEADLLWGTYTGGSIRFGTLIAKVGEDGALDMRYQHVNKSGELMTGACQSVPEILPDGRIRLKEAWQWTTGDRSEGRSVIEEV
jgi:hypothetical protein